ncbi:MAG: hypothetical protein NZM37_11115 [Sandaracinaceae bacterium]|nr:hypothetical protein [Sandaracinaceae bacterium]
MHLLADCQTTWVSAFRHEHEVAKTRMCRALETSVFGFVLVVSVACPGSRTPTGDGGVRGDTPVVETSLRFDAEEGDGAKVDANSSQVDAEVAICIGACDPVSGMGCRSGQSCVLRGSSAVCGSNGGAVEGSPCNRSDGCTDGYACFAIPDGGVCARVCCPLEWNCRDGQVCVRDFLVDGSQTTWGRCMVPRPCELTNQGGCGSRWGCYVYNERGARSCLPAGSGQPGSRCEAVNDCVPGALCVGAFDRTCLKICTLGTSLLPCDRGETCIRQGYLPEGIGVCAR